MEDRSTRRARSRRARQQSPFERYRGWIITGAAVVGVLIVGYLFFQGAGAAAYTCDTLLTPGPVESVAPRPSIIATPTPVPTPSATAEVSAPSTGAPSAPPSPAPSGSPTASQTPSASVPPSASPTAQSTPQPEPTPRLGFTTDILGRTHVRTGTPLDYAFCPPTSGEHNNDPPRNGPIPAQVYPPAEEKTPGGWVHNLEHGFIVLLYRCPEGAIGAEGCPTQEEMNQMQTWFDTAPAPQLSQCPKKVLVARFDSMSTRFAVLAWGRALLVDEFDLDTALTFAQQWMEHEAVPERTAPC